MNPSVLIELLHYKTWADQELMQCLCDNQDRLPVTLLNRCVRLMNHIHVVDNIFAAHLSGQAHAYSSTNTETTPTPEALSWDMQRTNETLLQLSSKPSATDLDSHLKFQFTDGDSGSMSPSEIILHVGVHSTYHRGQVSQMLKDAGIAPPRDLLTRKLHAQEPERRKG